MIKVLLFGIVLGLIPVTCNCIFTIEAWRSTGTLIK